MGNAVRNRLDITGCDSGVHRDCIPCMDRLGIDPINLSHGSCNGPWGFHPLGHVDDQTPLRETLWQTHHS